nr:hypothetical protein Iba_chr10dCG15250 [Ipomoea batatas]
MCLFTALLDCIDKLMISFQSNMANLTDLWWNCCRKKKCLALLRNSIDDSLYVSTETHIQQMISLIKHQNFNPHQASCKTCCILNMIFKPSRCSHKNLAWICLHPFLLQCKPRTSYNNLNADCGVVLQQFVSLCSRLTCKFSSWAYHKHKNWWSLLVTNLNPLTQSLRSASSSIKLFCARASRPEPEPDLPRETPPRPDRAENFREPNWPSSNIGCSSATLKGRYLSLCGKTRDKIGMAREGLENGMDFITEEASTPRDVKGGGGRAEETAEWSVEWRE